ncbi:MAG: DUF6883 domain-containing protein [Hyphomicrobium sp.]
MSGLPNPTAAVISDKKIVGYLLSPSHPEGTPKSKFFEKFGFSCVDPEALRHALLAHARRGKVIGMKTTEYGTIYEVNGRIESPDSRNPWVLVVWMIDVGTNWPRLITAVPSEDTV